MSRETFDGFLVDSSLLYSRFFMTFCYALAALFTSVRTLTAHYGGARISL